MSRQICTAIASGLVVLLLSASHALADPIVVSAVTAQAGGFEYSYDVTNPTDATENIFDFALPSAYDDPTVFFAGQPMNITGPTDWDIFGDVNPATNLGFINWLSNGTNDLTPGNTFTFSFFSLYAPGTISYNILSAAPGADLSVTDPTVYTGTTQGPVQGVPEPSTWVLLALGGAFVWSQRRRLAPTL